MLDNMQTKILLTNNKNVFINAGAGSGKTRVIIAKINSLINKGVLASEILAITFTKKAAEEMKTRLENEEVNVFTFHSFCYWVLINQGKEINISQDDTRLSGNALNISKYKTSMKRSIKPWGYNSYQRRLEESKMIDFDDLMLSSLKYINKHYYKYIFIDEFQDINNIQYLILNKLKHKNNYFLAVGDLNQAIYRFRGANNKLIYKFIKEYNAKVFELNYNYRCGKNILRLATKVINLNNGRRNKVNYITKNTKKDSYYWLVGKTSNEIFSQIREDARSFLKIGILYRYHYQARNLKKIVANSYMTNIHFHTFHETKGLEFDCVYIIGCEVIPVLKSYQLSNLKEEIRLFYVAITRAKNKLVLESSKKTRFLNKLFHNI